MDDKMAKRTGRPVVHPEIRKTNRRQIGLSDEDVFRLEQAAYYRRRTSADFIRDAVFDAIALAEREMGGGG